MRREEAAQLCDISTSWYTCLEQGRDASCSTAILARIAKALRLSPAERLYLFELAQMKDPDASRLPVASDLRICLVSARADDRALLCAGHSVERLRYEQTGAGSLCRMAGQQ